MLQQNPREEFDMRQQVADDCRDYRLARLEIERAADRLIKVHGPMAFSHAAKRVDVALKKGDEADRVFWHQIAEKVKRQLPANAH